MNPQTSESVDTRILPKYTLYIGPQGAHKAGNEAPGIVGAVLLLGACTKVQMSWIECEKFINDVKAVLAKGKWVRLSSSEYRPYRRYRGVARFIFHESVFIERITFSGR